MKRFGNMVKTLAAAAAALLLTVSCEKPGDGIEPVLDVTANNIAGDWQVESWSGKTFGEGCYVYMRMIRKGRLFEIYQNIDTQSSQPRKITGEFNITTDEELGAILRGKYDHGLGDWEHRYIVSELTEQRMVLVAQDDRSAVVVYKKIPAIPAEITELFPADEE